MQFSQNEQLQDILYPRLDEIISQIDNGNSIPDLHQIMDQIINQVKLKQLNFDSIANSDTETFITKDIPKIIIALIHSSANTGNLIILYKDLIGLTILFNFHFSLLKALMYPFEHTEKIQKPPRLFQSPKQDQKKQNIDSNTSTLTFNPSPKTPEKASNINFPKVQLLTPQSKKTQHVSAPPTPTPHSSHIATARSKSTVFNVSNFEESHTQTLTELANTLFTNIFSGPIRDLIVSNNYSIYQFCTILSLFVSIEPYLPKDICIDIINFLNSYTIINFQRLNSITSLSQLGIFKFITAYSKLINSDQAKIIYTFLIQILTNVNNSTDSDIKKLSIVCILNTIFTLFKDHGPSESSGEIKNSLFNILSTTSDNLILEKIYKFLPIINSKQPFTIDEIAKLYMHVTTIPNIVTETVYTLITNPKREHLDLLAKYILSYSYFSPSLTIYLIDHTDSHETFNALFDKIIGNMTIDTNIIHRGRSSARLLDLIKTELNTITKYSKMSIDNMKNSEETINSIKTSRRFIVQIGIFLIKISSCENIAQFISSMIAIRDDVPEVEKILCDFIDLLNPDELIKYYNILFEGIIDILLIKPFSYNDRHCQAQKQRLSSILTKWTYAVQSFPESVISRLIQIDYTHINSEILQIINAIVQRSTNKKSRRKLAIQIALCTVRPRYASWAMMTIQNICIKSRSFNNKESVSSSASNVGNLSNSNDILYLNNSNSYDSINSNNSSSLINTGSNNSLSNNTNSIIAAIEDAHTSNLAKICDILISNLTDESKKRNTIHMIMWGAMIECDFYKLKGKSFFSQKISFEYASKKYEFDLSFHPFHSMRRIYAAVSEIIQQPVDIISITLADDAETPLKIDDPLSNYIFDVNPNTTIYLNVKLEGSNYEAFPQFHQNIDPKFLNRLEEQEKINILRDNFIPLTEEGEIICQILMLIDSTFPYSRPDVFYIDNLDGFFKSFEFSEFTRLFPMLLHILAESNVKINQEFHEIILDSLCDYSYGTVSLSIACRAILKLFAERNFSKRIIKKCLLDTNYPIIRKTFASLISDASIDTIQIFLDFTVRMEYRTKTKQFFELVSSMVSNKTNNQKNVIDTDIFLPFFFKLEPYEISHYIDADESFIGLISLLKPNDEVLDITFERLFATPTIRNPHLPFCQTIESRRAAFEYVYKCSGNIAMKKNQMDKLFKTLLNVPTLSSRPLSDDLSFIGRNVVTGCPKGSSLGTIISLLTNVDPLMEWLFYLDQSKMAPHVAALREFMATIIYNRNGKVDINPLLQFPEFLRILNAPCDVILYQLFNLVDNYVDSSFGFHSLFQLKIDERPIDFISLKVKGYSNMESSLNDYLKIDSDEKHNVDYWPDYLIVYLDRIENGKKIVNQFEFPLYISEYQYTFIGAVLQSGLKTSGRYSALSTNYSDWFVSNSDRIEYFNQADIPFWCFGANDDSIQKEEDFTCASLLLYQRSTDKLTMKTSNYYKNIKIPSSLEEKINFMNQQIWPSIVLSSPLFVNLVLKLNNNEIIFNTLFRICLSDTEFLEKMLPKFKSVILKSQSSQAQFKEFSFNFGIEKITNESLELSELLSRLYIKILKNKEDLKTIIEIFMKNNSEYQYYFFLNVLSEDYSMCEIDSDLMSMSLKYLTKGRTNVYADINKENDSNAFIHCSELVLTKQKAVFEILIKAVAANMKYKQFYAIANEIFDPDFLEKWSAIIVKSDVFKHLIEVTNNHYPNIISSIISLTPQLGDLFSKFEIKDNSFSNMNDTIKIVDAVWEEIVLRNLLNPNKNVRDLILTVALNILPKPNKDIEQYIQRRIIDPSISKPIATENSYGFQFTVVLPEAIECLPQDNDICDTYLEIIESRICYISPVTTSIYLNDFFAMLNIATDSSIREWILMIIHHILAFDQSKVDELDKNQVEKLLSTNFGNVYAIQILYLFRHSANRSQLSGSCFDDCFKYFFDEHSAILLKMIQEGLIIGKVSIDISTTKPKDLMNLQLINAIFKNQKEYRRSIYLCIKNLIDPIKQMLLLGSSQMINDSLKILDTFDENVNGKSDNSIKKKAKNKKQIKNQEANKNNDESNAEIDVDETEDEVMQFELYQQQKKKNNKSIIKESSSNDLSSYQIKKEIEEKEESNNKNKSTESKTKVSQTTKENKSKNKKKFSSSNDSLIEEVKTNKKDSKSILPPSYTEVSEEEEEEEEEEEDEYEEEEEKEEKEEEIIIKTTTKKNGHLVKQQKKDEINRPKSRLEIIYDSICLLPQDARLDKLNEEQRIYVKEIAKICRGRPPKEISTVRSQMRKILDDKRLVRELEGRVSMVPIKKKKNNEKVKTKIVKNQIPTRKSARIVSKSSNDKKESITTTTMSERYSKLSKNSRKNKIERNEEESIEEEEEEVFEEEEEEEEAEEEEEEEEEDVEEDVEDKLYKEKAKRQKPEKNQKQQQKQKQEDEHQGIRSRRQHRPIQRFEEIRIVKRRKETKQSSKKKQQESKQTKQNQKNKKNLEKGKQSPKSKQQKQEAKTRKQAKSQNQKKNNFLFQGNQPNQFYSLPQIAALFQQINMDEKAKIAFRNTLSNLQKKGKENMQNPPPPLNLHKIFGISHPSNNDAKQPQKVQKPPKKNETTNKKDEQEKDQKTYQKKNNKRKPNEEEDDDDDSDDDFIYEDEDDDSNELNDVNIKKEEDKEDE